MVRHTRLTIGSLALIAMLLQPARALAAEAAKEPLPADRSAPAAKPWSVADIAQHIDALERVTPAQAGAEEVVRILLAIMHQPDPATRLNLFNRLRPHIAPYPAPSANTALRVQSSSTDQPPSP